MDYDQLKTAQPNEEDAPLPTQRDAGFDQSQLPERTGPARESGPLIYLRLGWAKHSSANKTVLFVRSRLGARNASLRKHEQRFRRSGIRKDSHVFMTPPIASVCRVEMCGPLNNSRARLLLHTPRIRWRAEGSIHAPIVLKKCDLGPTGTRIKVKPFREIVVSILQGVPCLPLTVEKFNSILAAPVRPTTFVLSHKFLNYKQDDTEQTKTRC
jgi:hypothetical protein